MQFSTNLLLFKFKYFQYFLVNNFFFLILISRPKNNLRNKMSINFMEYYL